MRDLSRQEARAPLLAIIVLSLLLRVGTSLLLADDLEELPGTGDQLSYHTLAIRVLSGDGFSFGTDWWPDTQSGAPTAHWSYLYTLYLASVYAIFGVHPIAARLIQATSVGILQPLFAYLLGRRLFGEFVGLAAGVVAAVYAYFVYYSATLMTEPFYIAVILVSLYLAIRLTDSAKQESSRPFGLALLLGLVLGLAVLLRQVFLLFVPILLFWVWWANDRRSAWVAILPGLVVALMVLPFTLYNSARFDSFVLLNTNAGFAFFWANHPIYGTRFEPILPDQMGDYQELIPEELRGLNEAALDRELLRRGLGFVVDDPVRYLRLSLSRIPAYFMFWPSGASSAVSNLARVLSFGLFLPFMLYGLIKAWSDRRMGALREPVGLLALFIIVYSAIHLLSWSLIRYRLPVDAVLVIFAGYALADLVQRFGAKQSASAQPA